MDATQKITKNLGGNRLGSGDKMNIDLHAYNRSTHDLSRAFRSTMNVGTLVPFFKEFALNGETWEIDLQAVVRTVPTIGPIYGSYKLQADMFVCPVRLYNGLLHNNMVKIGMKMNQVKFPKINISTKVKNPYKFNDMTWNNEQISSSALVKYLGISGIGDILSTGSDAKSYEELERKFNAVPMFAYFDIYKNYYANKQEDKGVIIANGNYQEALQLTTLVYGSLYTVPQPNYGEVPFNAPSTPPTTVQAPLDGYQQLNVSVILHNGTLYSIPKPARFDNDIKIILKKVDRSQAVVITSYETHDVRDIFPNATFAEYNINLMAPSENYMTDSNTEWSIYAVNYNTVIVDRDGIKLKTFDLENIDNARIAILRDTGLNNELLMNSLNYYPYLALYEQDNDGFTQNLNSQQGLAIKTYQSDLLENWLNTEWIDGQNGINSITAVDTTAGSFTIDALNFANKYYNLLNRIAVSGGTYEDWQEAVFSTEAVRRSEQPIYVGGMSCEIAFEEVVATTAATDQALGELGGKGTITNVRGGNLEIRIDEPSYIIGIVSITPRLDYSQGNDWDMTELSTMDDVHKPELDAIGFEDLLQERAAYWGTYYDKNNDEWVKLAMGKTPAWINYMTAVNKSFGGFAEPSKEMFMILNRQYKGDPNGYNNANRVLGIYDLTTYIDPTKYNYGFADTELEAQNFWVQLGIKAIPRRVMSAKVIPSL